MGLCLFFLPHFPAATFIQGAMFIPDSRVIFIFHELPLTSSWSEEMAVKIFLVFQWVRVKYPSSFATPFSHNWSVRFSTNSTEWPWTPKTKGTRILGWPISPFFWELLHFNTFVLTYIFQWYYWKQTEEIFVMLTISIEIKMLLQRLFYP